MYLRLSEHFDLPRCHDGGECPLQAALQSLEAELCPHTYLDVESRFLEGKRKKEFDFWSQQII